MSDNWLMVIPRDPLLIPPEPNRMAALKLLCDLRPRGQEPELEVFETPVFMDCGFNFEAVICPFCAEDLMGSWREYMNSWWERGHRILDMETPCCGKSTTLNDLKYFWPQGFACVSLELMNPGPDFEPHELEQIEAAFGTPIRVIWRHL